MSFELEDKEEQDFLTERKVAEPVISVEVVNGAQSDNEGEQPIARIELTAEEATAAALDSAAFEHLVEEVISIQREDLRPVKPKEPVPNDRFEDTPDGFEMDFLPDSQIGQDMDDQPGGDDDFFQPFDLPGSRAKGDDDAPPGDGGGGGGDDDKGDDGKGDDGKGKPDDDDEKKPSRREAKRREQDRVQQIVDHTFYNPD